MFGRYIHPQLVDDLAVGLCARFNIKAEPKDVVRYINNFGYDVEKGEDLIISGFPIGKIESQDQFRAIQKMAFEKDQYYNVKSGRWMNDGNKTMVYGDGWCAKRNSPEHQAMLKVVDDSEESDSIVLDKRGDWMVVEDTNYIWSKEKESIIGRLKNDKPVGLTRKAIKCIKDAGYPWERVNDEDLEKYKISF